MTQEDMDYQNMIADLEASESCLTRWEADFVSSVGSQLEAEHSLSEAQVDKLTQIWEKVVI